MVAVEKGAIYFTVGAIPRHIEQVQKRISDSFLTRHALDSERTAGAGHMLVFNNGGGRPDGNYSSVDEVVLPVDAKGNYTRADNKVFGPDSATWSYTANNPTDFFAPLMSGAQRLPNGNTLICAGFSGEIFEVTPSKEIVWKFIVPDDGSAASPNFGPPRAGGFGTPGNPQAFNGGPNLGPRVVEVVDFLGPPASGEHRAAPLCRAYRYGVDFPASWDATLHRENRSWKR